MDELKRFSLDTTTGCTHGCLFCYVPSASTNKLAPALAKDRVQDDVRGVARRGSGDAEWITVNAHLVIRTLEND